MKSSTAAHHAALATLAALEAAEALFALPWGQRGCFFVADRAISWDGDRRRVLYRNGRPVMAAERCKYGPPRICPLPEPRQAGPSQVQQAADAAMVRGALRRLPKEAQLVLIQLSWGRIGEWELSAGWTTTPAGGFSHPALPGGWEYRAGQEGGALKINNVWHGAGRAVTDVCGPALALAEAMEAVRVLRRSFGDTSRL